MIEATYKVSGTVSVPDEDGKTWDVEYVANISDHGDTCDPEIPINMEEYDGRFDAVMEACYADAYRQIGEEGEKEPDPDQEEHTPLPWTSQRGALKHGVLSDLDWVFIASFNLIADDQATCHANADFAELACNNHDTLVVALQDLTDEINLSKLNIRKDFSLINAHACALKALHSLAH